MKKIILILLIQPYSSVGGWILVPAITALGFKENLSEGDELHPNAHQTQGQHGRTYVRHAD